MHELPRTIYGVQDANLRAVQAVKQLVRNLAYPRNGIDVLPYVVCITSAAMHCFDTV